MINPTGFKAEIVSQSSGTQWKVDQCLFKQRLSDSEAVLNDPPAYRGTHAIDIMTKAEVHLCVCGSVCSLRQANKRKEGSYLK